MAEPTPIPLALEALYRIQFVAPFQFHSDPPLFRCRYCQEEGSTAAGVTHQDFCPAGIASDIIARLEREDGAISYSICPVCYLAFDPHLGHACTVALYAADDLDRRIAEAVAAERARCVAIIEDEARTELAHSAKLRSGALILISINRRIREGK